jgi:hypothetical protein
MSAISEHQRAERLLGEGMRSERLLGRPLSRESRGRKVLFLGADPRLRNDSRVSCTSPSSTRERPAKVEPMVRRS